MTVSDSPALEQCEDSKTYIVSCNSVTKVYPQGDSRKGWFRRGGTQRELPTVRALDSVSLQAHRGEFLGISGPSGSGKSTLLHILGAIDTPSEGTVDLLGSRISELSERRRAQIRLAHIGIVFQRFYLLPSLSARENVALPLIEQGVDRQSRRSRASTLLERVGLGDRGDHRPGELSGGEQQRVAVARALVTDPELLIADEPTGELDSEAGADLIELLSGFATERSVIVASHDDAVISATDRVLRMRDGRLVSDE